MPSEAPERTDAAHEPFESNGVSTHSIWTAGPCLALALGSAVFAFALIWAYPTMFWNDPYLRVLERDHLLADRWLPLVQAVVYATTRATTDISVLRMVFAVGAAFTVMSAAIFAAKRFSHATGLIFAALLGTNALFVAVSLAPYQEVPFLGLAFVAAWMHERRSEGRVPWAAAIAFNVLCLTRYEGWLLVGVLVAIEMARDAPKRPLKDRIRVAAGLGATYGAAAVGWVVALVVLGQTSRLWQQRRPELRDAGRHLATYLYRTGWELAGCPGAYHRGAGLGLTLLLLLLAAVGLSRSLAQPARRGAHLVVVGFVLLSSASVILGDPYSKNNLRETFLPVACVLLYSAEGLRVVVSGTLGSAFKLRWRLASAIATILSTSLLAGFSARSAAGFVARSSNEPDFRVPAAVGRRLAQMRNDRGEPIHVVALSDNNVHNTIVAAYARLATPAVAPVLGDLPAGSTHVAYIPQTGTDLTGPGLALEQRLAGGLLPADAEDIDSATIWTLKRTQAGPMR